MKGLITSVLDYFKQEEIKSHVRAWVVKSKRMHKRGADLLFSLMLDSATRFCKDPLKAKRLGFNEDLISFSRRYANDKSYFESSCYLFGRLCVLLNIKIKSELYAIFERQFIEVFTFALGMKESEIRKILVERITMYSSVMGENEQTAKIHNYFSQQLYARNNVREFGENSLLITEDATMKIIIQEWDMHVVVNFLKLVPKVALWTG